MKRYEDHVLLIAMPGGEQWTDALPLVDEGLASLPEKDRQILLAHFWLGLTYQEIATARSSTEAAVQRRASRAFEKLSAWLGKRRVAVPGGILTAGLATLSQPVSAVGAAPQLAVWVLEKVPHAAASSIWAWRVRETLCFGKMKFAAGVLTGTFVALLGGTGFAIGRALAREDQARLTLASDTAEARAALKTLTENTPLPEVPARRSLGEIVAAAAAHYRDEADPAGTARGEILLEQVLPDEVPAAMALLGESIEEETIGTLMVPHLIQRWRFAVKADEAVVWVLENIHQDKVFRNCIHGAVRAWASKDPAAARAWWRGRTDLHPRAEGMSVYHAIFMGYGPENLGFLWQELPSLEEDERQAAEDVLARGVDDPAARQNIYSLISAVPDERIRASLFKRAGRWLAQVDPETAVSWMKALPLADDREAFEVRAKIAGELADQNPGLAARVMLQNPAGALRDLWVTKFGQDLSNKTK